MPYTPEHPIFLVNTRGISTMTVKKQSARRAAVTSKRVTAAVRKAKKLYAGRKAKRPAAWQKGGREYARVLGHFGVVG